MEGLEPPRLSALAPKASVAAITPHPLFTITYINITPTNKFVKL